MPALALAPPPRTSTKGRKPKPTETKEKPRPDSALEPKPEPIERVDGLPPAPESMDEHEGRLWEYFGGLVVGMKVLSKNDLTALAILCENEAARLELGSYLKENGRFHTIMSTTGDMVDRVRPQFTEWQRLNKEVIAGLREFGLTPASRPKIQMVPGAAGREVDDDDGEKAYW